MPTAKKPEETPAVQPAPEPDNGIMPVNEAGKQAEAAAAQSEPEAAIEQPPAGLPPGRYRFIYRDTTIYAALGVTAEYGDVHDWPDGPPNDGRWTPATEGE